MSTFYHVLKLSLLGFLVGIAGLLISFFQSAHELEEDTGLGLLFKLRGPRRAPGDAVVISIDKESANQLGIPENPEKWPRSLHARLVEILTKQGAAVVTFDVHFLESRVAEDDKLFASAISKAGTVVLGEPMAAREIEVSAGSGSYGPEHSIVKIVKPLPILAEASAATAPFVLPRIPFKVNQYWTFQSEGALSPPPTFPVVAYQLFNRQVFGEFVGLLEKVRPNLAGKLPRHLDEAISTKSVGTLMRTIKDIFQSDPMLAGEIIDALQRPSSEPIDGAAKFRLMTLVNLYAGPNRRYLNYYGPPHTVTTVPYYRALQLGENKESVPPINFKGKAVFIGLSERILAGEKTASTRCFPKPTAYSLAVWKSPQRRF